MVIRLILLLLILTIALSGCYISAENRERILGYNFDDEIGNLVESSTFDDPEIIVHKSNDTYNST